LGLGIPNVQSIFDTTEQSPIFRIFPDLSGESKIQKKNAGLIYRKRRRMKNARSERRKIFESAE